MDVKDFCNGMSAELTAWKAKMWDAMSKVEKLGTPEREKVLPNIEDIRIIMTELEDKVNSLNHECPSDWSGLKQDIEKGATDVRSKYEETMEYIGKAAPVSVPG
ncbi:conserved hypothetical protein [Desulfatibacillum aliphaticivorans]|uniref:Uncharacterized protein n=1 Tax=Desulfatibacillum aliphaticivorans TaxID=218208 RepID=B8FDB0_DESAL|nr:hypothetical protein [Desulfatibacillum aliphaticivorans]ACL06541.1 conserved hypothetical protein [Desulfatibacillum aliphaticivorans]